MMKDFGPGGRIPRPVIDDWPTVIAIGVMVAVVVLALIFGDPANP